MLTIKLSVIFVIMLNDGNINNSLFMKWLCDFSTTPLTTIVLFTASLNQTPKLTVSHSVCITFAYNSRLLIASRDSWHVMFHSGLSYRIWYWEFNIIKGLSEFFGLVSYLNCWLGAGCDQICFISHAYMFPIPL